MDRKVKRDLDRLMFDLNDQALIATEYIRNGLEVYKKKYPSLSSKEFVETCLIVIEDEVQKFLNRC